MRVSASDPPLPAPATSESIAANQSTSPREASPSFVQVLRGLGREIASGETTMRSAVESMRGGADLGPTRLIALQAGVYRYSEAIDLASRLVDRATSGLKTVVQGGGQ
jgi:hypothetical protein